MKRRPPPRRPGRVLALVLAACGGDDRAARATTAAAPATTAATTVTGNITVFAAASLTASFNEIGTAFTKANPDAKTTFNFDASSALVHQITQGAPADVFASADKANMDKLTDAGQNAGSPEVFATNELAIIVEPGNPKGINGLADLARLRRAVRDLRPRGADAAATRPRRWPRRA